MIRFVLVIGLVCISYMIEAQNKEFTKSYFPGDPKGLSEAKKNLKAGEKLYKAGPVNYTAALEFFLKAQQFNPDNAWLNYKIGNCYLVTQYKAKSVPYFEKAVFLNVPSIDVYYLLGIGYHAAYEFDKAIEQFTFYRQSLSPQELIILRDQIDKRIAESQTAKKLVAAPIRVFIDNLGNVINTEYDEYSPVLNADGSVMYFTSRRPDTYGGKKDKIDQKFFEDVYVTRKVQGFWQKPENLLAPVNTKSHDATAGLSYDGNTLFIYRGEKGGYLWESTLAGTKWSKPKVMSKAINSKFQETSAALSPDGRTMYFVSDRPGGFGGKDIYMSTRDVKGRWSQAVNMGPVINTQFDEESVFIHPDGKTLYFSSMGHNTMGGFDIFKTVFQNGRWTTPENLGYPVNTPEDDLFFSISANGKHGFFSSVRDDSYGGSDLYHVIFLGPEKPVISNTEDNLLASITRPIREVVIEEVVEITTTPMTLLKGKVLDDKTGDPLLATLELLDNEENVSLATFRSNASTGEFLLSLPSGKNYAIAVRADEYLFHSENIDISQSAVYREVYKDIRLKKVEVGQTIILNNIFFDSGKATLRPQSYAELGILYKLLADNPKIRVEISGHTDNVGSASLNQKLSQDRARAVVEYLVSRGIEASRLEFKGYGFEKPIASNLTEAGRQENRRTEFKILDK